MSGFASNVLLTLSLVAWVAVLVVWAPSSIVDLFTGRESEVDQVAGGDR